MNGFFTLIPLSPFSSIIPTRRWFFLCIFCRKYIYILSFPSFYTAVLRTCQIASFVVLHGCGAYTPIWLFCIVNKEIHQFDGSEYEIYFR